MPLVTFQSTTIWKAFVLNSLASAIVIVLAIESNKYLMRNDGDDSDNDDSSDGSEWIHVLLTAVITFATTFITYATMYFMFGFGASMTI